MELDGGTFLLQWSAGGLLFAWVTTRRRELSLGYGWLLRATYGVLGAGGAALLLRDERFVAGGAAVAMVAVAAVALAVSVAWRRAGVRGAHARHAARRARVAAMVDGTGGAAQRDGNGEDDTGAPPAREFPPVLDLIAALAGFVGVGAAAEFAGGPALLAGVRLVVGAAFLGAVTDAMLLGHWYLVQPGLRRDPVKELVAWTAAVWPLEVAAFLWPTGMAQVLSGTVDDGYGGLLGWVWVACAAATIALVGFTWLALRERFYSAVMAATGLLYLAILTAFGTDLVARAVLSP